VALWGAEEEGLLGSRAWARKYLPETGQRDKVSVYFNIDPGKGPIYGWFMENNDEARPIFDAWMAPFADLGYLKNVRQGIGNTDHLAFIAQGVPGFNPIQDYVDYDVREHRTNQGGRSETERHRARLRHLSRRHADGTDSLGGQKVGTPCSPASS
jgi:Zn-dependent M28 family amino/carboxypeptidase